MMTRLLAWAVLAAGCVFATTLEKLTLDDMVLKSTEIVRGRVVDISTVRQGPLIVTQIRAVVTERWKGPQASVVDVFLHGGTFQGLRQTFSGTPELANGAEYVFFLWAGKSGRRQIIGLSQGLFDIVTPEEASSPSTATALTARRAAIHDMRDPATGGEVDEPSTSIPLDVLRARVQRTLRARVQRTLGAAK
ncbi:MAG: hypothetical protein FJW31_15985 [Acidobacteria bacterium]|nr:hypothetical protein [Acidobacteriota bacterium]